MNLLKCHFLHDMNADCSVFLRLAVLSYAISMTELGPGTGGGICLSEGSTGKENDNKFKEKKQLTASA
jgi:hypothetical protein